MNLFTKQKQKKKKKSLWLPKGKCGWGGDKLCVLTYTYYQLTSVK